MNFRRRSIVLILILVVALLVVGCQGTSTANKGIVANVDSKEITKDQYNKQLALFKKNYEDMYGDKVWSLDVGGKTFLQAVQENVLEKLVNDAAIANYLLSNNVEIDDAEFEEQYTSYVERMKDQVEVKEFFEENGIDEVFIREQIKTDLYMDKFYTMVVEKIDLSDESLKKYYDEHQDEYRNIQVKASHILVEKEDEAQNILKKIEEGEDFSDLAKEYSTDPGSAAQGGDLGYFSKGMMVPEFEEAAFSLKSGEISKPVKSQYGYHIIKVEDTIDEIYSFEDVKEDIKGMIIDQEVVKKTDEIKKDIKIEKFEDNIK